MKGRTVIRLGTRGRRRGLRKNRGGKRGKKKGEEKESPYYKPVETARL